MHHNTLISAQTPLHASMVRTLDAVLMGDFVQQPALEPTTAPSSDDVTRNLRIVSVFVILAAGLLGGLPPLLLSKQVFYTPGHPAPRVLRALGAGIILALALIHVIPDSVSDLGTVASRMEQEYNAAGPCAVLGVLFMVVLDSILHQAIDRQARRKAQAAAKAAHKQPVAEAMESQCNNLHGHLMHDPHTHVCVAHQSHMVLDMVSAQTKRDRVLAYLFELGCVVHSVIIGLSLGVNTDNMSTVRGLVVALAFHQFVEGIALASILAPAKLGRSYCVAMVLLYSLTCPIGVAIGIGVADSYDAESTKAIATQGVFNAVSGGMLLYIALVQLIAEDFSRREITDNSSTDTAEPTTPTDKTLAHAHSQDDAQAHSPQPAWLTPCCYIALFVGAACMAILAIWA